MSTNCLVTKLKSVVDNDNLDFLGFVKLHVKFTTGFTGGNFASVAMEGLSAAISEGRVEDYLKVFKGSSSSLILIPIENDRYYLSTSLTENLEITILVNKYKLYGFDWLLSVQAEYIFDAFIKFNNLKNLSLGNDAVGLGASLSKLKDFPTLEVISKGNGGIPGTMNDVAGCTTLKSISFNYCWDITGDLSAIKDMPNLESVSLNPTDVTDNENTVAYLQNRGIIVNYQKRQL